MEKNQEMTTSKIKYLGNLRTEAVHLKSNSTIITDAPTDNNGKGEAFSPTDTVATALASCMITIMGIQANTSNFELKFVEADITKVMSATPRKISEVIVNFNFGDVDYSEKEQTIIKNAAKTCPVALSLNPDIKQTISFKFK